jgi:ceramide glucosyltransferase
VEQGYRIALAPYVVENVIYEAGLRGLFLHELRWARTIRSVQPVGYALSFITDILPLSLIAAAPIYLTTLSSGWALSVPAGALALRLVLHFAVCRIAPPGTIRAPWLIPLRDLFSVSVRVASFFGSKVTWRERSFVIHPNNQLKAAKQAAGR